MAGELRCSDVALEIGLDPIATAGCYGAFVLFEQPLPWPGAAEDIEELAPLHAAIRGQRSPDGLAVRLQLIASGSRGDTSTRHVIIYRHAGGPFSRYERLEQVLPARTAAAEAAEIVREAFTTEATIGELSDVLICTHGTRDRCCGSKGTVLFGAVEGLSRDHRVWRTSHTGGHRFAPNVVVLPEGDVWGRLDVSGFADVVARSGPLDNLGANFRGCSGLSSPTVQVLDRAAFGRVGWPWLKTARTATVQTLADGAQRVQIDYVDEENRRGAFSGVVRLAGTQPVPPCGWPIGEAESTQNTYVLDEFSEHGSAP